MESPGLLKLFLVIISLLTFFVVINILTSDSYLYRIINIQRKKADHADMLTSDMHSSSRLVFSPETRKSTTSPTKPKPEPKVKPNPELTPQPKPEPTVRPDACVNCFVHNFTYLIQNRNICNGTNGTIDLLMVILTIHANVKQRNNIRASWASIAKNNTGNVRYAFLLGKTNNEALMKSVYTENSKYGDILMEDFVDSYSNLTYKTLMGMKWASLFCGKARFVLKTDDDMWVNVPGLLKVLTKCEKDLQKSVGGFCYTSAEPVRDLNSKWYASIRSYPHKSYPGFCSGTGYVTSLNVAKKIYEVSPNIPFFHLEDVYMALCIRKLGMTLKAIPGFHNYRTALKPCEMKSSKILTSHQVPTDFLLTVMKAKC